MPYDLDKESVKISALSSGNVSKYNVLTSKDLLLEKHLLGEAATMKRKKNWTFAVVQRIKRIDWYYIKKVSKIRR